MGGGGDEKGLRDVVVDGLYNLMKRNLYDVIEVVERGFED